MTNEKNYVQVLDHGYIRLRNLAGPNPGTGTGGLASALFGPEFCARDTDVPQTARKSFNNGKVYTYEEDMRLADYLYRNMHTSPFEMIESWWDIKLPIFVDRQWVRHRTWARNEASGRYVQLCSDYYLPTLKDVMLKAASVKQGGRPINLDDREECRIAEDFLDHLRVQCERSYKFYERFLQRGMAPEQARMFLHVNFYVEWTGKVDLKNLLGFLSLRTHPHAQQEIRTYAWAMVTMLRNYIPGLMELWNNYELKMVKSGKIV